MRVFWFVEKPTLSFPGYFGNIFLIVAVRITESGLEMSHLTSPDLQVIKFVLEFRSWTKRRYFLSKEYFVSSISGGLSNLVQETLFLKKKAFLIRVWFFHWHLNDSNHTCFKRKSINLSIFFLSDYKLWLKLLKRSLITNDIILKIFWERFYL